MPFFGSKVKPTRVGQRIADSSDIEETGNNRFVSLDSNAFLGEIVRSGTRFNASPNVGVDVSNVEGLNSVASNTPYTGNYFDTFDNDGGTGRTRTFTNSTIQFSELAGGKLTLGISFSATSFGGSAPDLNNIVIAYGSISFTFPISGIDPTSGSVHLITINIPNSDYSSIADTNPTITLNYQYRGSTFTGSFTIISMVNSLTGNLHDAISSIAEMQASLVETKVNDQISALRGDLDEENAVFSEVTPRISPYRNNNILAPETSDAYFIASSGSDPFPSSLTGLTRTSTENPIFIVPGTSIFVVVPAEGDYLLTNSTSGTSIALSSQESNSNANLNLGSSFTENNTVFFSFRVTGLTINDTVEVFSVVTQRVVAWQDDIDNLTRSISRIDAELSHAALNLPDELIQVLDNETSVTAEENPSVIATDYNRSFSSGGTQSIFYESNQIDPSSGSKMSRPISETNGTLRNKLIYLPASIVYSNMAVVWAFDGSTRRDLIHYSNGSFTARKFVAAIPSGSQTVTVTPSPSARVASDWYLIPLKTSSLQAEADELFLVNDVPTAPTTINIRYRYDANGGHGSTLTTTLIISDINANASRSVTLALPDGETVDITFEWLANQNSIRIEGVPRPNNQNFFIFDMEVGMDFQETRTIPATPETFRDITIEQGVSRGDNVFAIKPSSAGTLIVVGDQQEVDTGYEYTTLFSSNESGHLVIGSESGQFLDYRNFSPGTQTIIDLENHATLPQFGLFTTEYTHSTTVDLGTQLTVRNSEGDSVKVGQEVILVAPNSTRWRLTVDNLGNISTVQVV